MDFVVLGAMNSIFSSTGISFGQVNIGILMLNIFIIASVEELIFRNMLVSKFGVVIAGIIFGVFHIVAYSYSLPRMIYAIIMHFVLYYIQKTFSRDSSSVNSGVHASINYFAYMKRVIRKMIKKIMLLLITCAILLFTGCQSMSIADQNGYIKIGSSCTSVTKGVEVGNKIVFSSLTECLNSNTDMKEEPIFEGLDYPQSNDNYCNEYQKDGWLFTTAGFSRCKQVTEGACRDARDFTFIYNSECDCVKEEILKNHGLINLILLHIVKECHILMEIGYILMVQFILLVYQQSRMGKCV